MARLLTSANVMAVLTVTSNGCFNARAAFCEQPRAHVPVDQGSLLCAAEEIRISFHFDRSDEIMQCCSELSASVMDYTLKTNSAGLCLGGIGTLGL